jgi:hypothetical protein
MAYGTSNTTNAGVAHIGFRLGGEPFCKTSRAMTCVTADNTMGYQICKRCQAKLQKMEERRARREAKAS